MTKRLRTHLIIFCFFLFFTPYLFGQYRVSYSPLRCVGELPADFLQLSSEKVQSDRKKISQKNLSNKDRKLESEFALNSNFGIDEILYSGKVLYGDVLSVYINKVADKVLEKDPALRAKLRFYVLKSASVNAFSTNQGIIFVSVGLISQVENEAQLAFILCHEITHYVNKHGLESYKRKNEIIKGKGRFKQLDFEDRVKQVYSYSKENEIEADKEGLKLFLKTSYNPAAVSSSFDVLLYAYLPHDEIEWYVKELQDSFYQFPSGYTPAKGKEISADEAEDDEESTHPNIKKRKAEIEDVLSKRKPSNDTAYYLLGLDYFNFIQQQSRVELFFILLNHADYEKAYYLSFLYKHNYYDTAYADRIAAYCMYAKSIKQFSSEENSDLSSHETSSESKNEGAFYYVSYFFDKLSRNELAVLSVRTAWKAYQHNRNDSFYQTIFEESAKNLFKYTDYDLSKFFREIEKDTIITDSIIELQGKDPSQLSKVEKLKLKQKKQAKTDNKDADVKKENNYYLRWAFINDFKDDYFRKTLEYNSEKYKDKKDDEREENNYLREEKWHKKYGYAGNIDSLILINPSFSKIVVGKKNKRNLFFDEKQELELAAMYVEMARLNDIHVEPLNLLDKKNLSTEKLNEYALIMEWVSERLHNFSSDIKLFNSQFTPEIVKSRGTSKLCLSGISYVIEGEEFNAQALVYSIIVPPILPIYLIAQLHKTHYFNMTSVIFDLETGKLAYLVRDELRMHYNKKDYVNSQIYALFNQISKRTK